MKNQKGFGVVAIIIVLTIVGCLGFVYWRTYLLDKNREKITESSNKETYAFTPLQLDTTKWQVYVPFQGFTLKYPHDWEVDDSGNFVTVSRRTSGLIADTGTTNVTSKSTYFYTNDLEIVADENGYRQSNQSGEINVGSRIRLSMTAAEEDGNFTSANDICANYTHQETEILKFEAYSVCQVQIANDSGDTVHGYDFHVSTDRVAYLLTVVFNPSISSQQKDYYISNAREIVASYKLY